MDAPFELSDAFLEATTREAMATLGLAIGSPTRPRVDSGFHDALGDIAGAPQLAWPSGPASRRRTVGTGASAPLKGCVCILSGAVWPAKGGSKVRPDSHLNDWLLFVCLPFGD